METRKLQMVGGGTYTVSIPKEWATEHALSAGNPVHLYRHRDGSIVLRSARKDGGVLDTARVTVEGEGPEALTRVLRAAYVTGFETVRLTRDGGFVDAERHAVDDAVTGLVGAERSGGGDDLVVRILLDPGEVSVHQSVTQLQFVARSVHHDGTAALLAANPEATDRLRERADEANRLATMLTRHLVRAQTSLAEVDELGTDRPALFEYHAVAQELERVATAGITLAHASERLDAPLPDGLADDIEALATDARDAVEAALDAFMADSEGAAHAAVNDCAETVVAIEALDEELFDEGRFDGSPAAATALTRALDALDATATCGEAIADVATRAVVRETNC